MKNTKIVVVILSSVLLLFVGLFLYNKRTALTLKLPQEVNLKNIQLTDKPIFTFNITNVSGFTVEIPRIYTSCGCTTILDPTESFILKPNSTTSVRVQFDPSSMHKTGDNVYHEIYILTSKPTEKEYMVKMKGKIL
jgi:hypothetical protein